MSDCLSHSCPTCGGRGFVFDVRTVEASTPCPDCIEGYPKDRIERAAKALYEDGHTGWAWDQLDEALRASKRLHALEMIRAFHTEGTDT